MIMTNLFKFKQRQRSVFVQPSISSSPGSPVSGQSGFTHRKSVHVSGLATSIEELELLVKLPKETHKKDWIAQHAIEFHENLFLLIDSMKLTSDCTEMACPCMTGGDCYEYRWVDEESTNPQYHQPTSVSAPLYISLLCDWIESKFDDPKAFPIGNERVYPKKFKEVVKKIFSRLFRVFAHIYHRHGQYINNVGVSAHLNTLFKHFVLFTREFDLMKKEEYTPTYHVLVKLFGDAYATKFK
ncbi:hypothetical protein C9374_006692 [Naegleria lovaniensis]|uniref:Uncharacterized protein n=1 Tax=Naegleria lovaniensis TaxID=51637 RepID=A0AA88GMP3_NAELO|nr:uncharacterized protein C9374_006692 [Naegleria lovaniensis]KAG2379575.1 hypothetical protein C9374_006692 [Naegleria lovaniensis]